MGLQVTGFLSSGRDNINLGLACPQWMAVPGSHSQKARIGTETSRDVRHVQRLETEGPGMVRLQGQEQSPANRQPFIIQLLPVQIKN